MSSAPESAIDPAAADELILSAPQKPRRRVWLPLSLFLATMLSTFIVGASHWLILGYVTDGSDFGPIHFRLALLENWRDGLTYMACLLFMLLAHEMGHFLATIYYGVPASFPYFLPFPISPLGTLGAVIRMDSREADRKQMFDIGIAGPLAGLVVAIPLLIIGIGQLDLARQVSSPPIAPGNLFDLGMPLAARWLFDWLHPHGYAGQTQIDVLQINPFFMAGWVGLLVTGLNMMPVSQLDGGHIIYCLFGKAAHWIARGFMVLAIAYMVYKGTYWMTIMLGLILLIGIDHPPTSNDHVRLGPIRYALGIASLAIPMLCLSLEPIIPR